MVKFAKLLADYEQHIYIAADFCFGKTHLIPSALADFIIGQVTVRDCFNDWYPWDACVLRQALVMLLHGCGRGQGISHHRATGQYFQTAWVSCCMFS